MLAACVQRSPNRIELFNLLSVLSSKQGLKAEPCPRPSEIEFAAVEQTSIDYVQNMFLSSRL